MDNWLESRFRYVLPLGHGREKPIAAYTLDRGLLHSGATGGETWNPLASGRTYLQLRPFFRAQTYNLDSGERSFRTNGLELSLEHEDVDFIPNPTQGSSQRVAYTRDFGWLNSSDSWTVWELELNKYFSLGDSPAFRQRVIALAFWTADTPSWEEKESPAGGSISHRPPPYKGASLGGFFRMKGYPTGRFNDRAAIYYSGELRLIPRWNPLGQISWLQSLKVDWWQFVSFAEVGNVSGSRTLERLHSDMKWNLGLGLRFMARKFIVRFDTAFSDETWQLRVMANHPF